MAPSFRSNDYNLYSFEVCISNRICTNRVHGTDIEKRGYITGYRIYSELNTGDIILFRHGGKLHGERIAATKDEVIERNGVKLTVPEDCYYVFGDNEDNSFDSRYWEEPFVREEYIPVKALCL